MKKYFSFRRIATVAVIVIAAVAIAFYFSTGLLFGKDEWISNTCQPLPPSRIVTIDTAKVDALASLPSAMKLQAGQYALTFDDGPMIYTTPQIVKILHAHCIPATFFMIGIETQVFFPIVSLVHDAGYTIGTHMYLHGHLENISTASAHFEVAAGIAAAEAAMGGLPNGSGRLFRYPRWQHSDELQAFVRSLGATAVYADITPEDWRGLPASESIRVFRERLANTDRGVIVLHDVHLNTVDLLPMVIDEVTKHGGQFVQLVAKHDPPLAPVSP